MIDLSFKNVSKRYRVRQEPTDAPSGNAIVRKIQSLRRPARDFWALQDVSFEVQRGEALGIIGHNGAGKSTILKLLANITAPTVGEITINGRLAALIEVGSGFHPELTGRENIYLNGSILGMRRREIARKLKSIVEFAGVQEFLDTPVKRFSSGMYVRLGFSIAAHLDPDILLLDEVLAVGDSAFQSKCLRKIDELKESGTTIVFISHDLRAVERTCQRVLLMQGGHLVASGSPAQIIEMYQSMSRSSGHLSAKTILRSSTRPDAIEISSLAFFDLGDGTEPSVFRTGHPLGARLNFDARENLRDAIFEVQFYSAAGERACQFSTEQASGQLDIDAGAGGIDFICPELGLPPGLYYTDVHVRERGAPETLNTMLEATALRVDPGKVTHGQFYSPHEWRLVENVLDDTASEAKSTSPIFV